MEISLKGGVSLEKTPRTLLCALENHFAGFRKPCERRRAFALLEAQKPEFTQSDSERFEKLLAEQR